MNFMSCLWFLREIQDAKWLPEERGVSNLLEMSGVASRTPMKMVNIGSNIWGQNGKLEASTAMAIENENRLRVSARQLIDQKRVKLKIPNPDSNAISDTLR